VEGAREEAGRSGSEDFEGEPANEAVNLLLYMYRAAVYE